MYEYGIFKKKSQIYATSLKLYMRVKYCSLSLSLSPLSDSIELHTVRLTYFGIIQSDRAACGLQVRNVELFLEAQGTSIMKTNVKFTRKTTRSSCFQAQGSTQGLQQT